MGLYKGLKLFFIIWIFLYLFDFVLFFFPYGKLDSFLKRDYSVSVYDRNNRLIFITPLEDGLRREFLDDIPEFVTDIFINSEDKRFYLHDGFDLFAIMRAFFFNFKYNKTVSGGSTISMQLSRLVNPTSKNVFGKFIEIINAIRIEKKLSKEQILKLWLNNIPFGQNCEGITDISRKVFGKRVEDLTYYQVVYLSMIPRNPVIYSELKNMDRILKVANLICSMNNLEFDKNTFIRNITNRSNYSYENKAWHFVNSLNLSEKINNKKKKKERE